MESSSNSTAPTASEVLKIKNSTEVATYLSTLPDSSLSVLYFHAPWAAPCRQMSAVLETLASSYLATSPPAIGFLSIDAEDNPDLSEEYDVTAVPYFILLKGGKVVDTVSGSDPARVRDAVEDHAGAATQTAPATSKLPPAQVVSKQEQTADVPGRVAEKPDEKKGTAPRSEAEVQADLQTRLAGLVKSAPVMLFMKGTPGDPQCGFSRQTVEILREKGIRYGFFNILADNEVREGLKKFADWPTYPQLWVEGELAGGLDIIKEEFGNDPKFLSQHAVKRQRQESS